MTSDEKVGYEMLTKWLRLRVCLSNLGALVRMVREIPYLYEHGAELPDHQERIAAWLAEARALVGGGDR